MVNPQVSLWPGDAAMRHGWYLSQYLYPRWTHGIELLTPIGRSDSGRSASIYAGERRSGHGRHGAWYSGHNGVAV